MELIRRASSALFPSSILSQIKMLSLLSIPLFYLLACLPLFHAYTIDTDSCKFEQYALLHAAIEEAFTMADAALDAIANGVRDDDVNRLIVLLFGKNGKEPVLKDLTDTFTDILARREMLQPGDDRLKNMNEMVRFGS